MPSHSGRTIADTYRIVKNLALITSLFREFIGNAVCFIQNSYFLSRSSFLFSFFPSLPLNPSFRQLWIENKLARHVSRHNHRALSGMIKFSTARLTEFPSGGERSARIGEEGKCEEKRGVLHSLSRFPHWFFPTLLSRPNFAFNENAPKNASDLVHVDFQPLCHRIERTYESSLSS